MNIVERVYARNGAPAATSIRQDQPIEKVISQSLCLCRDCPSCRSRLKEVIYPISLTMVLIGPAWLVSDSVQIFSLLMVNIAIGVILGIIKYRFSLSKTG